MTAPGLRTLRTVAASRFVLSAAAPYLPATAACQNGLPLVSCEGSRSLDMGPGLLGLCIEKHGLQRLKNPGETLLLLRLVLPLANMDLDAVRAEFEQFSPRTEAPKTSCAADAPERVPGWRRRSLSSPHPPSRPALG